MTNALPYHYEPLEARRNELMMEDSGTQGIIVLEDDQMIIYPMNSRETMTILRRSLLSLLHHVVRFRLENPAIANVSLLIELKALQCYVFEVATYHSKFGTIAKHCFTPVLLRPDRIMKSKTLAGMKSMIFELMYLGDSVEEILQTFLSLEHWNTFELYSLRGVATYGKWMVDADITLAEAEAIANGSHPNSSRLSTYMMTRHDPMSQVHLVGQEID